MATRIRLTEAAEKLGISVGSLRKERDLGRLVVYRLAGKDWTTQEDLDRMFDKCQEKPKAPISISNQNEKRAGNYILPSTSSETDERKLALNAARMLIAQRKKNSKNTSSKNTSTESAEIVTLRK